MKEELITFDTAQLAKEKGCDLDLVIRMDYKYSEEYKKGFFLPTQSLLQKWLREVHNIEIQVFVMGVFMDKSKQIHSDFKLSKGFRKYHYGGNFNKTTSTMGFKTYEEALEKGLQEALKLI